MNLITKQINFNLINVDNIFTIFPIPSRKYMGNQLDHITHITEKASKFANSKFVHAGPLPLCLDSIILGIFEVRLNRTCLVA